MNLIMFSFLKTTFIGLFNGLLFSTILERFSFELFRSNKISQFKHQNVGKNLEARYVFL